jgi:hypothetical protein
VPPSFAQAVRPDGAKPGSVVSMWLTVMLAIAVRLRFRLRRCGRSD